MAIPWNTDAIDGDLLEIAVAEFIKQNRSSFAGIYFHFPFYEPLLDWVQVKLEFDDGAFEILVRAV